MDRHGPVTRERDPTARIKLVPVLFMAVVFDGIFQLRGQSGIHLLQLGQIFLGVVFSIHLDDRERHDIRTPRRDSDLSWIALS